MRQKCIRKLSAARALYSQYGLWRLLARAKHEFLRRSGLLRHRFPLVSWEERPLDDWCVDIPHDWHRKRTGLFFPGCRRIDTTTEVIGPSARDQADRIIRGELLCFSHHWTQFAYPDPDWHREPFSGKNANKSSHWIDCAEFDRVQGDIKLYWEPSRCAWAFTLGRAYQSTGDEKYGDAFWKLVDSWMTQNPPNRGIHWRCGQEVALRMLALIFGWFVFREAEATTPSRLEKLLVLFAFSAERIEKSIEYARIQMGNHATSEAAALLSVGLLFPFLKKASKWKKIGLSVLEDEARLYNWNDGSYTQHSFNYQRLMMHTYLWSFRLADLNGLEFSEKTRDLLRKSVGFIRSVQDERTGRVPNYGPNDGALLLQWNDCDYLDYRPLLNAFHFYFEQKPLYERGPWDEDVFWLFGEQSFQSNPDIHHRKTRAFEEGGYYVFTSPGSWGMTRCHSYRTRPNQADLLHFDLWWEGINLLRDSGSYSYFDEQTRLYFVSTRSHNTLEVNGLSQMVKGPRFQWHSLAHGKVSLFSSGADVDLFEGWHDGYSRCDPPVTHRRGIARLGEQLWVVVDDLLGSEVRSAVQYWNLCDADWVPNGDEARWRVTTAAGPASLCILCSVPSKLRLLRGRQEPEFIGWDSLYYQQKSPSPVLCSSLNAGQRLPVRWVTVIGLGADYAASDIRYEEDSLLRVKAASGTLWTLDLFPLSEESPAFSKISCNSNGLFDSRSNDAN